VTLETVKSYGVNDTEAVLNRARLTRTRPP
jgi:hypothetical protein